MSDSMRKKIEALLRKAESTEFAEEKEAFINKAFALMHKHNVDQATLNLERTERPNYSKLTINSGHTYSREEQILAIAMEEIFDILVLQQRHNGKSGRSFMFYGPETVLSNIDFLWKSLTLQLWQALWAADKQHKQKMQEIYGRKPTRSETIDFRHAFFESYCTRVRHRLIERYKMLLKQDTSGKAELALRNQKESITDWFTSEVGVIGPSKRENIGGRSYAGYSSGWQAGDQADISLGNRNVSSSDGAAGSLPA